MNKFCSKDSVYFFVYNSLILVLLKSGNSELSNEYKCTMIQKTGLWLFPGNLQTNFHFTVTLT